MQVSPDTLREGREILALAQSGALDDGRWEEVNLDDVMSPQLLVEHSTVKDYIDRPHLIERDHEPTRAVRGASGKIWIFDGNHRTVAAKLGGVKTLRMKVHK